MSECEGHCHDAPVSNFISLESDLTTRNRSGAQFVKDPTPNICQNTDPVLDNALFKLI